MARRQKLVVALGARIVQRNGAARSEQSQRGDESVQCVKSIHCNLALEAGLSPLP